MQQPATTAVITIVTPNATHVCTPELRVISRQEHKEEQQMTAALETDSDMEDISATWWAEIAKENGPCTPEQLVV